MPEGRFFALLQNKEFWLVILLLVLLGGSVGLFEGSKTRPFDWSVCFFVSAGAISIIRNFLSDWQRAEVRVRNDAGLKAGFAQPR